VIKYLVILLPFFIVAQNDEGSVSGKVLGDKVPLIGANVFLEGTTLGATTDSLGNYIIDNIPTGKYTVRADFLGYTTKKQEIYVSIQDAEKAEEDISSFSEKLGLEEDTISKSVRGNTIADLDFYLESSALDLDEIIVSASKVQQKVTEAPSVVAVINEKNIRRRVGVTDYNRLAAMAKGVDVTYFGSQGAQINARGFDGAYSTRFRQFYDGLYLGEALSGQVYSLLSGPPKESISRIEVLFGTQSALYGPDASQGLLNIIPKHPMRDPDSEINFSTSSLNNPRFGGRYVKNYEKLSIDISGELKYSNEIPYNNDEDDIFWVVGDTLYLTEDLFDPIKVNKNHISTNIYYRLNKGNELSAFYNYTGGNGYAMGSLGPQYNRDLINHQYGLRFNNKNHFFRITARNQTGDAVPRTAIGIHQVTNRNSDGSSMPWNVAVEDYGKDGQGWWLKYNSDDFNADYQYNNQLTNRLKFVSGFDYEFKDPKTDRTAINDLGTSPITGLYGGTEINESRFGIYGQLDYLLNNEFSINSSLRYDDHEFYGRTISPRVSLVRKNFLSGTLKLIAGTGFKAPTLLERNIYAGQRSIAGGTEGNLDPFMNIPYPQDFVIDAVAMGSANGFTIVDFKDLNGDGIYNGTEIDSLINSNYVKPLELEEKRSIELAYTGVIGGNNLFEINLYSGRYKNFKGPLTAFAVTGPAWNYLVQSSGPLQIDAIRQVNYGNNLIHSNPVPHFTYALTYSNLPIDVTFFGLEGGWKHLSKDYEISMNFSYFNDQGLVDKREKGKKYSNYLSSLETANPSDSIYADYFLYANVYSNTPNFKGSVAITNHNGLVDKLSSTITFKMTSPYDFVSGFFTATDEGKGTIPPANAGQSWFRNPGQIGGQLYADFDMMYDYSNQIYFGLSIKNLFESNAPTIPLTPRIPRSFVFETGYKFK
tara:strand:- start:110 stop:2902 length:2793 start_codon:yes stop_codon:yes gene_type:complete